MTLLARSGDVGTVLCLWDHLFTCARAPPGPILFHHIAVAFLISFRASSIMSAAADPTLKAELPLIVSKVSFGGKRHVREVVAAAIAMAGETPVSFHRLLWNACYSSGSVGPGGVVRPPLPISPALLSRLEARHCIRVSVEELVQSSSSRLAGAAPATHHARRGAAAARAALEESGHSPEDAAPGVDVDDSPAAERRRASAAADVGSYVDLFKASAAQPPRLFVIDCRPRTAYEAGHLATAFHVDASLVESDPEEMERVLGALEKLKVRTPPAHLPAALLTSRESGGPRKWHRQPLRAYRLRCYLAAATAVRSLSRSPLIARVDQPLVQLPGVATQMDGVGRQRLPMPLLWASALRVAD